MPPIHCHNPAAEMDVSESTLSAEEKFMAYYQHKQIKKAPAPGPAPAPAPVAAPVREDPPPQPYQQEQVRDENRRIENQAPVRQQQ